MLKEMQIRDFGIIESVELEFHEGFHAISGETGAGKSILLQALSFALGSRADAEWIRAGASETVVTTVFELGSESWIAEFNAVYDFALQPGQTLVLRRQMQASGRSKAYLNDQLVSLKTLQSLGQYLLRQVGQHAAHQLFEEKVLFKILDQFGAHQPALERYQTALKAYREASQAWTDWQARLVQSQQQEDFLRFQRKELEQANLKAGEEAELEGQRQRLKHRVTLANHAQNLTQWLKDGPHAVAENLSKAVVAAQKSQALDEQLASWVEAAQLALDQVENLADQVKDYLGSLEADPQAFDRLESRLQKLHDLKVKYRLDEAGLLEKLSYLQQSLSEIEDAELSTREYEAALKQSAAELRGSAEKLSALRDKSSVKLAQKIQKTLKDLALPHARVEWRCSPIAELAEFRQEGGEHLTLWVSFNPGEALRPLAEVVSGGELSRLLLAIDEILSPLESRPMLIFDEVDAGVGGAVADLMGRKLQLLAGKNQVLAISHLPQIACQAKWHYVVEKKVQNNRTYSSIRLVQGEARVQEIARMLAGFEVTHQALVHARELLKERAA